MKVYWPRRCQFTSDRQNNRSVKCGQGRISLLMVNIGPAAKLLSESSSQGNLNVRGLASKETGVMRLWGVDKVIWSP